jgi:hypothetical protein
MLIVVSVPGGLPAEATLSAEAEAAAQTPVAVEGGAAQAEPQAGEAAAAVAEGGAESVAAEAAAEAKPAVEGFDASLFAGIGKEAPEAEAAEGEAPARKELPKPKRRRPRKPKHPVRLMVETVLGGVLGLAIAYYGLNLFGGSEYDFLKVWLPFCKHTQSNWPFAGQKASDGGEKGNSQGGKAANEPAKEPKSDPSDLPPPPKKGGQQPKFETSDDVLAPPKPKTDDEPKIETPKIESPLEPAKATSAAKSEPAVGPRNPPSYSSDDLGAALKAANDAFGCTKCGSKGFVTKGGERTTCDACKGKPKEEMTPGVYEKFCRLAEAATFVAASDDPKLADRKAAIEALLERVGRAGVADEVGKLACGRMQADPPQGGIFLAGTLSKQVSQNGLHGMSVEMFGIPQRVSVMCDRSMPGEEGATALVLGAMIAKPAENLAGYAGSKPMVVWSGMSVKLTGPQ